MSRRLLHFLFLSTLVFTPLLLAEESQEPQQEQVVTEKPKFIALSDVAEEAAKTDVLLKEISENQTNDVEVLELHKTLPYYIESVNELLNDPIYEHLKEQSLRELQKIRHELDVYKLELVVLNEKYQERIDNLEVTRGDLENYSNLWSETHINATDKSAPPVINEHITNVIIQIEELRDYTKETYDLLLVDLNIIIKSLSSMNEKIENIKETELFLSQRVFHQDQAPFTHLLSQEPLSPILYFKSIYTNITEKISEFRIFFTTHPDRSIYLYIIFILITVFIGYFYRLYRKRNLFVKEASFSKKRFFFLSRPISTAVILFAFSVVAIYFDSPRIVREIIVLIVLLPVLRIIQTLVHEHLEAYFYAYVLLYIGSILERNALEFELMGRLLSMSLSIGLIILIIMTIKNRVVSFVEVGFIKNILYKSLPFITLLLVVSIIANLYGATLLSDKITHGIFTALQASIIFYALTVILSGYVIILLRRRISTASNVLDLYATKIESYVTMIIKIFMVLWWLKIVIRLIGAELYLTEVFDTFIALSWVVGSTTISISSILSFIFIIVATWFVARMVNVLLEVEIFARINLARGVPTAISTTLNYIILISGILLAFSSLGVSTEQLALIFGALGVGIGFGLRNIIANFISGIIMVFERPIQIGDTIEVDNTMGKVLTIGSRASSVQTFDGSEVIVPNESFISSKVINWTLSDERRRKTLEIKVAFDSDLEEVLSIMREAALSHPDVLKDPEPLPTFQGFGDYYLEFKLYYWLTENLIVAQSDVAIDVYKRLKAAGIATPMPIQELVMPKSQEEQ